MQILCKHIAQNPSVQPDCVELISLHAESLHLPFQNSIKGLYALPPTSYFSPLPPPPQAPGAEGAASPAEGGAAGPAAA